MTTPAHRGGRRRVCRYRYPSERQDDQWKIRRVSLGATQQTRRDVPVRGVLARRAPARRVPGAGPVRAAAPAVIVTAPGRAPVAGPAAARQVAPYRARAA